MIAVLLQLALAGSGRTQIPTSTQVADAGLREVKGKHFRLITDLPLDDELRSLPVVFDQAIPLWKEYFGLPIENLDDWRAVGSLIQDRERFVKLGLITAEIPDFKDGFQAGSRLFFMEQPSPYYRRHLMLHEGTHWFMYKLFGGGGPTWYMEGMAELLGTHTWDGKVLKLGAMPARSDDVPYWGRVRMIEDQLKSKQAPSLESIMKFEGSARMEVDVYAWSWAASVFFMNHPDTKLAVREVAYDKLDYSSKLNSDLYKRLKPDWQRIRMEWEGFASELGYGYDLERAMPTLSKQAIPIGLKPIEFRLQAARGWQSTGYSVKAGDRLKVKGVGRFVVAKGAADWISEPQGITLRYANGFPLGMLLACVATAPPQKTLQTNPWRVLPVGEESILEIAEDGQLMFKLNDKSSMLSDNSGECKVTVERIAGSP